MALRVVAIAHSSKISLTKTAKSKDHDCNKQVENGETAQDYEPNVEENEDFLVDGVLWK